MYDLLGEEEENSIASFTHNIIPLRKCMHVHTRTDTHTVPVIRLLRKPGWVGCNFYLKILHNYTLY